MFQHLSQLNWVELYTHSNAIGQTRKGKVMDMWVKIRASRKSVKLRRLREGSFIC